MAVIIGEVEWASIQAPNTKFEPCWTIDVLVDAKQAKAYLSESKKVNSKGVKIKKESDGRYRIKIARGVAKANGDGDNPAPVVRDKRNKDISVLVGNGSVCKIQYRFYEWKNGYGIGVGSDLKGVQVLELVEYGEPDGEEFGDEDEDNEFSNEESETEVESKPSSKKQPEFDDDDFDNEEL